MHKKVLIFGGNGKIGSNLCNFLSSKGHYVLRQDKSPHEDNEVGLSAKSALLGDITENSYLDGVMFNTEFDVVINASYPRGPKYGRSFDKISTSDFNETLSLALGTSFAIMQKAYQKSVEERREINLINFSSIYGVVAPRFDIYEGTDMTMPVEYAAIKSAIISLTRYFAKCSKGTLFRVNCISPGGVKDGQDEKFLKKYREQCLSKGMLDANDLNEITSFLISDGSRFINGQNFIIDDGFTL